MPAIMRGNPFFSRNSALLFAGIIIFAALIAVGGEDSDGIIDHTTGELTQQRSDFERDIAEFGEPEAPEQVPEDTVFSEPDSADEDDFLIDDTEGFDPSPESDTFEPMLDTSQPDIVEPDEPALPDEDLSESE